MRLWRVAMATLPSERLGPQEVRMADGGGQGVGRMVGMRVVV